jgi:rod shape-determining protein MreC
MPLNQLQSGSPNLRRVLFALLLIASIVMCAVYVREGDGGPLHTVQNSVRNVTGYANGVGAGVGVATGSIADVAADATANPDTLTGLREQNEQLRNLLAQAEEYRQEANRLQGLLNMKQTSGVTGPVGHIVGRSTNAWDQSVTIDLGTEEGVSGGMAVMGASGVIGQISKANAHTSTVRLLTDPNSGAAVKIQSSRANAIVRGSLTGLLYLEDIEGDQIPEVGDVIVTSGLGGSYSSGLLVGAVVAVNRTAGDATGTIIVNPNASAADLEVVIVVTDDRSVKPATVSTNIATTESSG